MASITSTHLVIKRRAAWNKYSSWLLPKSFWKEEVEPFCSLTHKSTLLYNGFHKRSKLQTKQHLFALTYIQCKWDSKYANGGRKEMHVHYPSYWLLCRIWVVIAYKLDDQCAPLLFFFNIWSQSNLHLLFLWLFLSVKAGLVFQELNPTPIKPKPSGWNITTGLFIWAGRLFLDISKTFFISTMSLVLKPNLSPSVYSCGAGVSGISAILEQFLWSASSWSDKPRWVLSLPPPDSTPPTRSLGCVSLSVYPPFFTVRQGPCLIFVSQSPATFLQCLGQCSIQVGSECLLTT